VTTGMYILSVTDKEKNDTVKFIVK
jgi:hypothetical protein